MEKRIANNAKEINGYKYLDLIKWLMGPTWQKVINYYVGISILSQILKEVSTVEDVLIKTDINPLYSTTPTKIEAQILLQNLLEVIFVGIILLHRYIYMRFINM